MFLPVILVVESDPRLRNLVTMLIENSFETKVISASCVADAKDMLRTHPEICCVVSDYDLPDGNGSRIFEVVEDRPFILISSGALEDYPEFKHAPPTEYLRKPFNPEELVATLKNVFTGKGVASPVALEAGSYFRASLDMLERFGYPALDYYIKLSDRKFVKVFHRSDKMSGSDLKRFRLKGMFWLYLTQQDYQGLVYDEIERIQQLIASKEVSYELSYRVSAQTLELIRAVDRKLGIPAEVQKLTVAAVDTAVRTIKKNPGLFALFSQLEADQQRYIIDHSILLAHVSCSIASLQPWLAKTTYSQLAHAAFLHDITLHNDKIARLRTFEEFAQLKSTFRPDDADTFISHPEDAAGLVRQIRGIPPETDAIVAEHHERPDGLGFPKHLDHNAIRPLVCVFILAHEMVDYLHQGGDAYDLPAFLMKVHQDYRKGHFWPVFDSIQLAISRNELAK